MRFQFYYLITRPASNEETLRNDLVPEYLEYLLRRHLRNGNLPFRPQKLETRCELREIRRYSR